MKKLSLASIIAAAIIFSACNGNSNTSTSTDTTTNSMSNTDTTNNMNSMDTTNNSANAMATTVDDNAKDFAKEAAEGGMMEVQLGNIAEKNAVTQSVKDFGKMMVDDHSKINDNLKDLAAKKNH